AEYFQVKCPCDFQQYTYCPTYKPGDETKVQGCRWSAWSKWTSYSTCSVSCGSGFKSKIRSRTKQFSNAYTGSCEGKSVETSTFGCSNPPGPGCNGPLGCKWSPWMWSGYTECSVTCCTGTKSRVRTRVRLPAASGRCLGNSQETFTEKCDNPCGCTYNRRFYAEGISFPSTDRCNKCMCKCGNVLCTEKLCCTYKGRFYAEGSSIPSTDECNTCSCRGGKVVCTKKQCGCRWNRWSRWSSY
ncbi:unnamed protein product, partial [Owenia fusiformis]